MYSGSYVEEKVSRLDQAYVNLSGATILIRNIITSITNIVITSIADNIIFIIEMINEGTVPITHPPHSMPTVLSRQISPNSIPANGFPAPPSQEDARGEDWEMLRTSVLQMREYDGQ